MKSTCGSADCPKTNEKIICGLCEWFYPYGGAVCKRTFHRWLNEVDEVKQLHEEYLKESDNK